jgi:hypothetical protein
MHRIFSLKLLKEKARSQAANGPDDYLYGLFSQKQQLKSYESSEKLNQRTRVLSQSYTKLAPNSKNTPIIDTDDAYYSSILMLNNNEDDYTGTRIKSSASRYGSK